KYNPHELEARWRKVWEEQKLYKTDLYSQKPKHYMPTMFPYPSGNLHIGHWYAFSIPDTRARFMRMRGFEVLFPMGFDAFGLPAENAAIKNNINPAKWTYSNIEHMTNQFKRMGTMIDWETSELRTCDPEYYKWNQWFFLEFYKRGLAYKKESFVNWDPVDNTVLANEQVIDGRGDRSGALVERRLMSQWHLKITEYAEELLDFSSIQWSDKVRVMQTNWIGKSEGAEIDFQTPAGKLTVFTTRPDTVFGTTFMVLAPEHPMVQALTTTDNLETIRAYQEAAKRATDIERTAEGKDKTGVFTGSYAKNPLTGKDVPIFISDYVLVTYGTGSIMGVPAQDDRDWAFAKKFNLEIIRTVQPPTGWDENQPYLGEGIAINSDFLNGLGVAEAKQKIISWLEENGIGRRKITYRLRDWLISRQRYWGTPIPIIYCPNCGQVPVPEQDLPIRLPEDVQFLPTGQSPLTLLEDWKNCTCPKCGSAAVRDTDTMDTFVDSSWYYYRYLDPKNDKAAINKDLVAKWNPADWYTGGIEHAILHLLYARFWTKAMRDMGLVEFSEPFTRLMNQGIILGEDNEKMSKSRGNVVDPDALVAEYGTDTVRLYLQFIGPWDQGGPWAPKGVNGLYNWLGRVWSLFMDTPETASEDIKPTDLEYAVHYALKKVTEDTENFKFNTSIAAMMELSNFLGKAKRSKLYGTALWAWALETFNTMLAPYAPHMAEELWHRAGNTGSVHLEPWRKFDPSKLVKDSFELVVQVNGKVRAKLQAPSHISSAEAIALARGLENLRPYIEGKETVKEIYIERRLVNIVVKG
ncbi:MAG: leucine--tRNA ligase, partial [Deinococcales bacterium]